jgi:hypothetical protein
MSRTGMLPARNYGKSICPQLSHLLQSPSSIAKSINRLIMKDLDPESFEIVQPEIHFG